MDFRAKNMFNFSSKNLNKVVLGSLMALLLILPSISFGQSTPSFNNDSKDRTTLNVSNYTQNPGCSSCWGPSASAKPGEIVSFVIYYHNTSNVTANNTRLRLNLNLSSSSLNASGSVSADNGGSAYESANVSISPSLNNQSQPTFQGAEWYPNQGGVSPLPGGQSGSEVLSGGVNIGNIAPGWSTQGYLVVRYKLPLNDIDNGTKPSVTTNSATNISQNSATLNSSVNPNGSNTTSWFEYGTTQNLGSSTHSPNIGSGNSSIKVSYPIYSLSPNTTYYFRAVAQNNYGTSYGSILNFKTSAVIYDCASAPSINTNPASGISTNSATLNGFISTDCQSNQFWFEYGTTQSLGNSTNHQSVAGNRSLSSYISGLSQNTTYYFRAVGQNTGGTNYGDTLSFKTQNGTTQGDAPLVITKSATSIYQNSAILKGSVNPNGYNTTSWFEYGTSQNLGYTTNSQSIGSGNSSVNTSSSISGLSQNTTYYFRAVAQNSYGTSYGSILSFHTTGGGNQGSAPIVVTNSASGISASSATLNGSVNPKNLSTSYWFEYGTSQNLGYTTNSQSAGSGNSSIGVSTYLSSLSQNTTYYFRAVAQNSYGTSYGSILSFYTSNGVTGQVPYVQTISASNVGNNYAEIRGTVNPNGSGTYAWFEYGTSQNLGNSITSQYIGGGNSQFDYSYSLSSLSQNTTYYFRAVAQNSYGTSYGNILSFSTGGGSSYNVPYVITSPASVGFGVGASYLKGSVLSNDTNGATAWFEYGVSSGSLLYTTNSTHMGSSSSYADFNQAIYNLNPGTTYYFRAVARNSYGTGYGQILNFSTLGTNNGNLPVVITKPATYVYRNSALLNGEVTQNIGITSAWFEYGTTMSLGQRTLNQAVTLSNYAPIASAISSLSPNTTYYFRAAAQNSVGISYGQILSFTTAGGGIYIYEPPVVVEGSGLSCIVLVPALNVSELKGGEQFTLTVTYKNGCAFNLGNAFLKVILPTEVDFVSTNYPFFNRDANGISYNLGVVPKEMQSAISITGTVKNSVNKGDSLIFSTVLNFNDAKGKFQSVSAYLTAIVGGGKALGASVFDAFSSLIGNWLFDLLLVLAVIFLIYWIFFKRNSSVTKIDPLKT